MKEALKKTWVVIVLALALGATSGVYFMTVKSQEELADCKNTTASLEANVTQFCSGTKLMRARVTTVRCNAVEEICVCGDPNVLNAGPQR